MATLTVSHYIYLTKEQRYALHDGKTIDVVGTCISVWFHKGNTSEPAQEIFCKYNIHNPRTGANIKQTEEGFEIWMPSLQVEDDDYDEDVKFKIQKKLGTTENLLDYEDKGSGQSEFKLYQKLQINETMHHLVHFFEIKPIEKLVETLS